MAEARANLPGLPAFGGYDDQFVDAVDDDFLCVICQLPLKEPILTKCGHRFCTQCLNGHFERLAFLRVQYCKRLLLNLVVTSDVNTSVKVGVLQSLRTAILSLRILVSTVD